MSGFAEVFENIKVKHKQFLKDKAKDDYNRRLALDKINPNLSVFSKMYQGASGRLFDFYDGDSGFLLVNYPGVMLNVFGDTSDMNLFLKEEIDFVSLKNRNKDTKLVVLFGACTIRGGQCEEAFVVKYLKEMLDSNLIVLNCGLSAVTWENFLFVNTFLYPLFPDIVVNLCFTEIILCQYNCDVCLKTYQIPYSPTYELKLGDREDSVYSYYQMTISGKQNFKNPNITKDDIFEALDIRLLQFSNMVASYGGRFYAVIHPFLHLKKSWSKEEKWAYVFHDKQNPGVYNGCEDLQELVYEFLQRKRQINIYNSNDYKDLEEIKFNISNKTMCLVGNSGVGKSTLLNKINPNLALRTQEISKALNRGKHTTTNNQMIIFNNGMFIDTPGFSSIDIFLTPNELAYSFHDFRKYSPMCKFSNCLHINEPNCQIKKLVETNRIDCNRYNNYLKMQEELKFKK